MVKGNKDCCCGGCSEVPWDRSLPGAPTNALQPVQQYCCACVPKQLCVSFEPDDTANDGEGAIVDLKRPCDPGPPLDYTSVYRGELALNGEKRDIELAFVVEDQVCYLALTSEYLGADGSAYYRVEIDDLVRSILCPRCEPCPEELDAPETVEFGMITTPYAGTLHVRPVGNVSIPPKARCEGCPDPCDNPYATEETEECRSSCPKCGDCSCICRRACITVIEQGSAATYTVDLCNDTWFLPNGMAVSIVAGAGGCCALSLDPGGIVPVDADTIDDIPIGDQSGNPCPYPNVQWEFQDSSKTPPEDVVLVAFNCFGCGSCVQESTSCCPDGIPRVLTASVDGGPTCCGSFDLAVVYDPIEGSWIGDHPTLMCGHAIRLSIGCDAGGVWSLAFEGAPCTEQVDTDTYGQCDPLSLSFTVPAQGIDCCGGVDPGTLNITVTE